MHQSEECPIIWFDDNMGPRQVRESHRAMLQRHHEGFHSTWGQLTKTGYSNSRFAHQVCALFLLSQLTPLSAPVVLSRDRRCVRCLVPPFA